MKSCSFTKRHGWKDFSANCWEFDQPLLSKSKYRLTVFTATPISLNIGNSSGSIGLSNVKGRDTMRKTKQVIQIKHLLLGHAKKQQAHNSKFVWICNPFILKYLFGSVTFELQYILSIKYTPSGEKSRSRFNTKLLGCQFETHYQFWVTFYQQYCWWKKSCTSW